MRFTGWVRQMLILTAALVMPTGAAFAQSAAATGRIHGLVTLSRDLSARKHRLRVYAEYGPGQTPASSPTDTNELKNVVAYLDSVAAHEPPDAPSDLAIAQQHESFQPHVLPVLAGWSVAFPNRDPIFHNVFSLSRSRRSIWAGIPRTRPSRCASTSQASYMCSATFIRT
jgi:plastocyanin